MKRLLQLVLLAVVAKVGYDLVQKQRSIAPLPEGAPYEPAPMQRPDEPAIVPDAAPAVEDDLTKINGIGPVYAGRLRDVDIAGFVALASADTEALAEALDVSAAQVADWQAQAHELAS